MPAAKLAGGISFHSPNEEDSGWCCEPCNAIEINIDELEERVNEAERRAEAAWETAEVAIKICNHWIM